MSWTRRINNSLWESGRGVSKQTLSRKKWQNLKWVMRSRRYRSNRNLKENLIHLYFMFIFRKDKNKKKNIFPNILYLSALKLLIHKYSIPLYHKLHPCFFTEAILKKLLALFEIYMTREDRVLRMNHLNLIK